MKQARMWVAPSGFKLTGNIQLASRECNAPGLTTHGCGRIVSHKQDRTFHEKAG
jgi:hypothetical protein